MRLLLPCFRPGICSIRGRCEPSRQGDCWGYEEINEAPLSGCTQRSAAQDLHFSMWALDPHKQIRQMVRGIHNIAHQAGHHLVMCSQTQG